MQLWKKLGCAASCVTASHRRHRINPFLPPFLPPFYSILSDKQIDLLRAKNKWVPPSQHLGVLVRVTGDRMSFFPSCCKLLFFGSRPLLKSLMALLIQERQQREPGWGKKYAVHRLNCHAELLFFFFSGFDWSPLIFSLQLIFFITQLSVFLCSPLFVQVAVLVRLSLVVLLQCSQLSVLPDGRRKLTQQLPVVWFGVRCPQISGWS